MSPAEKARMKELEKKFGDGTVDEREMFFARLNAKHPNEVGAGPIWDSRMIFTKIRADRIVGGVERLVNKDGKNATMNFTPWSYHWGQANYNNAANWSLLSNKDVSSIESTYNMQGLRILQGQKHNSGYTAWLVLRSGLSLTPEGEESQATSSLQRMHLKVLKLTQRTHLVFRKLETSLNLICRTTTLSL